MKKKVSCATYRIVLSVIGLCLAVGIALRFSVHVSSQQTDFSGGQETRTRTCKAPGLFGRLWDKAFTTDRVFTNFNSPVSEIVEGISNPLLTNAAERAERGETGTLEKMIVAKGRVAIELEMNRLIGNYIEPRNISLRFAAVPNSFFTIIVFNDELRGTLPSSMELIPQSDVDLPTLFDESFRQLIIGSESSSRPSDLVVRDGKTGIVFFDIEGQHLDFDAEKRALEISDGRLRLSRDFAAKLGRTSDSGTVIGKISITATMRPIEITRFVDGQVTAEVMPALNSPSAGTVPGPDVIVGDLSGLAQFGSSSGTQVGLAVGTDSCNFGTIDLNWLALPNNDHPVIPQNLYRMSGGPANEERFEQIGQSSVKHAFTALTQNLCALGCNGVGGSKLGSGCSDPYSASLNSGPSLGSRAWINPFTGAFPRGDSATPPNTHTGHTHTGTSHRILTEIDDLSTTLNPGATYYAESQYVTPHEYAWCLANPTQCNMNNNVSYRRYNVTGTGSPFTFTAAAATVRSKAAIVAWTGATLVEINPAPGTEGIGTVGYKVTNPTPGVWHYEYAVYNQNMDRGIQSFSVPLGAGVTLSNIGFHAPPQHPGWTFDGTMGNTGFSSAPWTQTQTAGSMTWNSETFAQNPNANAIRWGTLYNFRFDSNRPPQSVLATIGFFKTGAPITVSVQGPTPNAVAVRSRADFDGDGKTDLSVFRPSEGNWYLLRSTSGFGVLNWGIGTDTLVPGDFDGDGKADSAIFRADANAGTPDFYYLKSNGFVFSGVSWGIPGDIPISGDYDGDGKTDAAVFRPSNGTWYILNSADGSNTVAAFGLNGDVPMSFDLENDGKSNLAVYRPSNNTWYIARNTGNPATNFDAVQFGSSGDMQVPADYDGDNKDDVAVFRPSNGTWYIRRSADGGVSYVSWGLNGDVPVPGDYDGDGKDDVAIYRGGTWYVNRSTAGILIQGFGLDSDRAIPKAYIP